MRVKIKSLFDETIEDGEFLGLIYDKDGEDISAVVRLEGHGMMLTVVHPSRVQEIKEPIA